MNKHLLAIALCSALAATAGHAQTPAPSQPASDCASKAKDKKLAGAALSSFMKKCERDSAAAACDAAATEKKLAGAARSSFTKKCVKDAAGKAAGD